MPLFFKQALNRSWLLECWFMGEERLKSGIWSGWWIIVCVTELHYQIHDSFLIITSHHLDSDNWLCNVSSRPLSTASEGLHWSRLSSVSTLSHNSSISIRSCMLKRNYYCIIIIGQVNKIFCAVLHKAGGDYTVVFSNPIIQKVLIIFLFKKNSSDNSASSKEKHTRLLHSF